MNLVLDDAETAALRDLLKETVDNYRWRLSPTLRAHRSMLEKIEPPSAPKPIPHPAQKIGGEPSMVLARKRKARR